MKVAALVALGVLIALPAEAVQRHRQPASPVVKCDNDGRCTTDSACARTLGQETTGAASQNAAAAAAGKARVVDANGNNVVIFLKTGATPRCRTSYTAG